MFEKVELIQVNEFPLTIKEGFRITNNVLADTKIGVALRFQYQESAGEVVAMHSILTILSASTGEDLVRIGCTLIFRYCGWESMSHEMGVVRSSKDIADVAYYLLGLSGGIFYKTMKQYISEDTPFIPLMNEEEILSKMSVEHLD